MKQLWAPWGMAYIEANAKGPGCIFCSKYREADLRSALFLAKSEHTVVMMNKFPYNNGHLLLAPKRHENNLASLPCAKSAGLNETWSRATAVARHLFRP